MPDDFEIDPARLAEIRQQIRRATGSSRADHGAPWVYVGDLTPEQVVQVVSGKLTLEEARDAG